MLASVFSGDDALGNLQAFHELFVQAELEDATAVAATTTTATNAQPARPKPPPTLGTHSASRGGSSTAAASATGGADSRVESEAAPGDHEPHLGAVASIRATSPTPAAARVSGLPIKRVRSLLKQVLYSKGDRPPPSALPVLTQQLGWCVCDHWFPVL